MKVYQCDSCGKVTDDPHETGIIQFYKGIDFSEGMVLPNNTKRKIKIDLCPKCFKCLQEIAAKKAKEAAE